MAQMRATLVWLHFTGACAPYQAVWHERNDFAANQFEFETGTLLGGATNHSRNWKMLNQTGDVIWQTPMDMSEWQNFAVTLDYAEK